MIVQMYVCMYECMYVRTYVRMYVCTYVRLYLCTYACMYVCIHACMHVCMHVSISLSIYIHVKDMICDYRPFFFSAISAGRCSAKGSIPLGTACAGQGIGKGGRLWNKGAFEKVWLIHVNTKQWFKLGMVQACRGPTRLASLVLNHAALFGFIILIRCHMV